jgi:transposase
MSAHDAAIRHMKRVVEVISRSENKSAACAALGVHRSTYYRWKNTFDRGGEVGRRVGWVDQQLERRVIAEALAFAHLGPNQVSDRLADVGLVVHPSRVWRILRRHGLNTAKKRRAVLEQHRQVVDPVIVMARPPRPVRHLRADEPGDLVQIDCFYVGSFKETRLGANKRVKGQVWQYTAVDGGVVVSVGGVGVIATQPRSGGRVETRPRHRSGPELVGMAMETSINRQRQRVPSRHVHHHLGRAGRQPAVHQSRQTPIKRQGRTDPRHDAARVLPTQPRRLRPTIDHRPTPRPGCLRPRLQPPSTQPRRMEPRPNPRTDHPTQTPDHQTMTTNCPTQTRQITEGGGVSGRWPMTEGEARHSADVDHLLATGQPSPLPSGRCAPSGTPHFRGRNRARTRISLAVSRQL